MSAALRVGETPVTQDANKWLRRRFRSSVRASFVINRDQISVTYSQRPILKETLRAQGRRRHCTLLVPRGGGTSSSV